MGTILIIYMKKYFIFYVLAITVFISCNSTSSPEGFSKKSILNHDMKVIRVSSYPSSIDNKISNRKSDNFPDSLIKEKKVYIRIRHNYFPGTKKIDYIDTAGYRCTITNDSLKLFWDLKFDSNLKITQSTVYTFEELKKILDSYDGYQ
ncbi:MAG: hypothetical protein COA32_02605 [Fluviicola sp.]|nr:MAG: hypothetical protein COA32_02605 [Fluviicola sp.]